MKIINNIRLSYYIYILLAFLSLIIISEIITIPKSVVLNSYSPSMTSLSFDIRPRNPQKLKLHIKYSYINQNIKILNNSQKIDQFIFSDQFSTIYIPFVNGANLLDSKFYQESVPSHFSKFGYDTKLFHSDINIGSIEKLWNLANFDEYYDGTDDFYENSERLIFGSVPDGDLLKNVFNKLINCPKDKPYFAYVMTSTSHGPFIVPKTHQQNYEEVFRYVDKEIWNFYQELKKCGFFDNGILVITGDHRSMTPYTNHEKNIYGEIGFAKVPLIIVGDDTFRDYQEINLSHISLGPMLEQINLPTYITNDLNHIPNLTNNSAIIVQKAYPTDEVLIKYKNQEYILELNSDKTGINNSSEEAMHLNKEILPEITCIRK